MSSTPEVLNAPDEILVLSVEEYLNLVRKMFENTPFVALNITRTLLIEPLEGTVGTHCSTLVAVGFEAEDLAEVPELMLGLTNEDVMAFSAQDSDIKGMIEQRLYGGQAIPPYAALPVLEGITHKIDQQSDVPELTPLSTLMNFT